MPLVRLPLLIVLLVCPVINYLRKILAISVLVTVILALILMDFVYNVHHVIIYFKTELVEPVTLIVKLVVVLQSINV